MFLSFLYGLPVKSYEHLTASGVESYIVRKEPFNNLTILPYTRSGPHARAYGVLYIDRYLIFPGTTQELHARS